MTRTSDPTLVDMAYDIEAQPETVWRILTTPSLFSEWIGGQVDFEPSPGSRFTAAFPQFETVVEGEIVAIDAESRHLRLSWGVASGPQADSFPAGCSLVEFDVEETGSGCRVALRHSHLPSEDLAHQHEGGWRFHLSNMALKANRSDLTEGLERSLAGWFSAWNEHDDDRRLETLRACCSEDVEFRDDWASASGVELLSVHIGNCFRYMPEWRLEATGDVRICRGEALVGWRGVGPGGAEMSGHNHVRARHDGTIERVTGFGGG